MRRQKVFVIGRNKTGTTSMAAFLKTVGYRVGNQDEAELFLKDWSERKFDRILTYCESADAFQDIPFSLDYTYQAVDQAFPGSKFILTVRDTPAQWYNSMVRFHAKITGVTGIPTAADLKQFAYCYPGYLWDTQELTYGITEKNPYDPDICLKHYCDHNTRVREYFRHRPESFIEVNVNETDTIQRLSAFLSLENVDQDMPHLNQSR